MYGAHQVPDEALNDEVRLANVNVHGLIGLVSDDDLRTVLGEAQKAMNSLGPQPCSLDTAERRAALALEQFQDAVARVSARIRSVYTGKEERWRVSQV